MARARTATKTTHNVPEAPPGNRASRWPALVLAVVVLLTFGRLTLAQFTWFDDQGTIVRNPDFNPPTWAGIGRAWTHPQADIYAPLTYTLWGVLAHVTYVPTADPLGAHVDATFYHGANVLLHLLAALAAYGLLRELCGKPWPACFGAMLFALHPLQVEAVAWASGTKDVMAGGCSLLALLLYVRAARGSGHRWWIGAAVAFAAALLSKPSAATVPLLAAIIDRWLLGRPWRKVVAPMLIGLAMALPVVIVNRSAQIAAHASAVPFAFRLFLPGDALAFYLYKLALPIGLGIQYPMRPIELLHQPLAYAGWLVPLAIALPLWASRQRWPWAWAAALIFAIAPLPVLGFLGFDWQWYSAVADHYLYVALLGPAVAVAYALGSVVRHRREAYVAAVVYLVVLAALSFRQAGFWRDNQALARHALAVNPRSFVAYTILGSEELGHDPPRAAVDLRAAFDIEPNYSKAAQTLKELLDLLGRPDEAREVVIKSLAANEALPPGQRQDGTAAYRTLARDAERRGDRPAAAAFYRKILAHRPDDADAREGMERATRAPTTRP